MQLYVNFLYNVKVVEQILDIAFPTFKEMCRAGEQNNKVTETCEDCPLNRYQDKEDTIPCKECPTHHVTLETGRKHVNECTEISGPEKLATTTTILYDTLPCSASSVAKATIEDKRMSMPRVANNTCNVSVSTTCSNNGTIVAMITLSASLEGKENLDVQTFYDSNTVSDNLHDLVNTVIELETSTQKLVNETAHTFEVQDGGIIHRINARCIDAVGSVTCPFGSVSSDGVCVECPVGTCYQSSTSTCQYCEIGAYQDETAHSVCKPCLLGYTTVGVGSVSIQDCTEKPVTINVTQDGKSRIKPDDGETNLALIIGCSLAVVVLVTSGLIGIIIYKWKTRPNAKGSFLSLRRAISPEPEACVNYQSPLFEDVKNMHFLPHGHLPPIISKAQVAHQLPPLRR